jgi:hypothetical protein
MVVICHRSHHLWRITQLYREAQRSAERPCCQHHLKGASREIDRNTQPLPPHVFALEFVMCMQDIAGGEASPLMP